MRRKTQSDFKSSAVSGAVDRTVNTGFTNLKQNMSLQLSILALSSGIRRVRSQRGREEIHLGNSRSEMSPRADTTVNTVNTVVSSSKYI